MRLSPLMRCVSCGVVDAGFEPASAKPTDQQSQDQTALTCGYVDQPSNFGHIQHGKLAGPRTRASGFLLVERRTRRPRAGELPGLRQPVAGSVRKPV